MKAGIKRAGGHKWRIGRKNLLAVTLFLLFRMTSRSDSIVKSNENG
jgi:hypothetical protein